MRQQTYFLLGVLLSLAASYPLIARGMATAADGTTTLSKEEVAVVIDTINGQAARIKALEKRLTTCFNNT